MELRAANFLHKSRQFTAGERSLTIAKRYRMIAADFKRPRSSLENRHQ
jgi:hypothetical protein